MMHFLRAVSVLAAFSFQVALSQATASPNISTIEWFSCEQNATLPVTCGTLAVPLDYTDSSSNKTLDLHLLKFNATKQPVQGSILFNPGGPGDSTLNFLAGYAVEMMMHVFQDHIACYVSTDELPTARQVDITIS